MTILAIALPFQLRKHLIGIQPALRFAGAATLVQLGQQAVHRLHLLILAIFLHIDHGVAAPTVLRQEHRLTDGDVFLEIFYEAE